MALTPRVQVVLAGGPRANPLFFCLGAVKVVDNKKQHLSCVLFVPATMYAWLDRSFVGRVGIWNEELNVPLDAGDAQSCSLQLAVVDATLQEEGLKSCTFQLGDFIPWNGYHLDVRQPSREIFHLRLRSVPASFFGPFLFPAREPSNALTNMRARVCSQKTCRDAVTRIICAFVAIQVHMGRDIRLRVSLVVAIEDPVVEIQHILHLEALLLTFPEGMPLPGVRREAGATVKSFIQCIPKVGQKNVGGSVPPGISPKLSARPVSCKRGMHVEANISISPLFKALHGFSNSSTAFPRCRFHRGQKTTSHFDTRKKRSRPFSPTTQPMKRLSN